MPGVAQNLAQHSKQEENAGPRCVTGSGEEARADDQVWGVRVAAQKFERGAVQGVVQNSAQQSREG